MCASESFSYMSRWVPAPERRPPPRPTTSPEAEIYRRLAPVRDVDRKARFVTALAVANERELLFETETHVEGRIAPEPAGVHGFGYDPIFFYAPLGKTTAELTDPEKAVISHRARAFRNLKQALRDGLLLGLPEHA